MMDKNFRIIIDTENYAGSFEREMCAYITGQIGECGVGAGIVDVFSSEIKNLNWFNQHVVQKPDEYGCYRPVSISVTPGWFNNGYGRHIREGTPTTRTKYPAYLSIEIYVNEIPDNTVLEEIIERAKYFGLNQVSIKEKASSYVTDYDRKDLTLTGIRIATENVTQIDLFEQKV